MTTLKQYPSADELRLKALELATNNPSLTTATAYAAAHDALDPPNITATPEPNAGLPANSPTSFPIEPWRLKQITCCPSAKTVLAKHPAYNSPVLLIVPCRRWTCPPCRGQKIRALAQAVHAADPNRLLTLTVDPKHHDNPELAWLATSRMPAELFRILRARGIKLEYLKVTEVTKKGFPHYHCLMRSDYVPQPVVKAAWLKLTGASIVDVRQVTKQFSAFTYLVKYLTKMCRPDWTERAVSYSRGFFPVPLAQDDVANDLLIKIVDRIDEHPWAYLHRHYAGRTLTRVSPWRWLLNELPNLDESEPPYAQLGCRLPTIKKKPDDPTLFPF